LEYLGVNGRIILKPIIKEVGCENMDWTNLDSNGDKWWAVVSTKIENSGSIKYGEFLD
jgi:hypothetical protein